MTAIRCGLTRKPRSRAVIGCGLIFAFAACGSDDPQTSNEAFEQLAMSNTSAIVEAAIPKAPRAELEFGDETFDFDSITCIGTTMATAVAADRANRDDYPTVTLKTFDPSMTGGMDSNTASIQFRGAARNELWTLLDGSVSRDGDVFQASGTVQGKQMVTQADGTLKSQPLEGVSEQPFDVSITCR